jgi:PAS domain S-box-containing protein
MEYEPCRLAVLRPPDRTGYPLSLRYQGAIVASLAALAVALSCLDLGGTVLPIETFTTLHSLLVMITVILAMSTCLTIASAPGGNEVGRPLVLAAALFASASLNFAHLMTMPTMPEFISESTSRHSRAFSIASGSLMSGALLALSISSRFSTTTVVQRGAMLAVYGLALIGAIGVIAMDHPWSIDSALGKVNIEWILAATLGLAALRFAKKSRADHTNFFPLMFSAAAILSLDQLVFISAGNELTTNRLARNVFAVVSYWCIYRAIFEVWVQRPFESLTMLAKALQKTNSTMRFQALALENAPVSIVLMDAAGQVTWQNRASMIMLRHGDIGTGAPQTSQQFPSEITQDIQNFLAEAPIWREGYQNRGANGALRYFDKSITAVKNSEGRLDGYVSVIDDITDTIKSELRYKRLLETAQDGFAIIDIRGNYLEVNDSFVRMVGYSREELLTMNAQALFITSATAAWFDHIVREKITEHPRYNATITKKDGSTVRVQCSVTFAVEEQQFFAFIHDSTLEEQANAIQRELENQLLHAQKVQALGALTSGIAHDFNNILASILGYSNLALDRFVPDKESKLARYLNEVVAASERARDLISKMLTFTRSKPNSSLSDVEPVVAIHEVVAMLRPSIPASIGIRVLEGPQVTVRIDSGELHQMLVNLTINARDAISSHGEITFGWELLDATGLVCAFSRKRLTGNYVAVFVSDTGSGIERETVKRIFDPYFTTKDVGKGSGLGLSMVQGIMHRAQGHVLVDSAPDVGTTLRLLFSASLPANLPSQGGSAAVALAKKGTGQRIWVVDDEAPIRGYMAELLGEWGYEVLTFEDPTTAWEAFQAAPTGVDLVVTDQTMHGMTGAELLAKIKVIRPDLPVVICSGTVDEVPPDELQQIKVFLKPVEAQEFLRAVVMLLA